MKSVNNSRFDELFKTSIYRDITEQLFERKLITEREYEKIIRRIDLMEVELIKPASVNSQHQRTNTAL